MTQSAPQASSPVDEIPSLDFPPPSCSICDTEAVGDRGSWRCFGCRVEWSADGSEARWLPGMPDDYEAERLECGDRFMLQRLGEPRTLVVCRLYAGHDEGDGATDHAGYPDATEDTSAADTKWTRWCVVGGRWTW